MNKLKKSVIVASAALLLLSVSYLSIESKMTDAEIEAKIIKLMQGMDPRSDNERAKDAEVKARYKDAIVVDMLISGTPNGYLGRTVDNYESMVALSKENDITHVSYTVAIDANFPLLTIIDWIGKAIRHWESMPEKYQIVEKVDDIYKAKKEGKFAVSMNIQGSSALGGDLNMVDIYYKLGVRQMNFVYNVGNNSSDRGGVAPDRGEGLSKAGIQLIKEMNRVGMIVDCTYSGNHACLDAAKISTRPIILSHSNPYGAYNLARNSPDEVLKAVAKTGGVICTNGMGVFLNKKGIASLEEIARHVNYVKELVGAEHACWGSNYVNPEMLALALYYILENPESYSSELDYDSQIQVAMPGDIWGVVPILEKKYGWSEKEIRGFLGENAMRVYKANWK